MSSNNLLTIDIGNSYSKCSLLMGHESYYFDMGQLQKKISDYELNSKNTSTYISNVTDTEVKIDLDFTNLKDHFKQSHFLSMPIRYNQTLGIDRVVAAYYAFKNFDEVCIIDSGTFTTVDFVSTEGFLGGYILPGLELLKSTYLSGVNLKSFTPTLSQNQDLPRSSQDSINLGLTTAFIAPINCLLESLPQKVIIITGGQSLGLSKLIKRNGASIHLDPNLIHNSMRLIHKDGL